MDGIQTSHSCRCATGEIILSVDLFKELWPFTLGISEQSNGNAMITTPRNRLISGNDGRVMPRCLVKTYHCVTCQT